jgi:hypothetical protein
MAKRTLKRRRKREKTPSKLIQYAPLFSGLATSALLTPRKRGSIFNNDKKPDVDDYELVEKKNKGRELTYRGYTITQTNKECSFEITYDTLDDTVIAIDNLIKSGEIMEGKKK